MGPRLTKIYNLPGADSEGRRGEAGEGGQGFGTTLKGEKTRKRKGR